MNDSLKSESWIFVILLVFKISGNMPKGNEKLKREALGDPTTLWTNAPLLLFFNSALSL